MAQCVRVNEGRTNEFSYYRHAVPTQCGAYILASLCRPCGQSSEVTDIQAGAIDAHFTARYHNSVAKLIVSDVRGGPWQQYIEKSSLKWYAGPWARNPNSGNYIRFYEVNI